MYELYAENDSFVTHSRLTENKLCTMRIKKNQNYFTTVKYYKNIKSTEKYHFIIVQICIYLYNI